MKNYFALFALFLAAYASARVEPAALFSDHLVIQRNKPIAVWGTADAGEEVTVRFSDETRTARADRNGEWRVAFPGQDANSVGQTMQIRGSGNTVEISDILVGEVWLASGQSNMEWALYNTFDSSLDIASAGAYPLIRHFKVSHQTSNTPRREIPNESGWQVAGPETAGSFSAVAFYFARELNQILGVPVGIVNSSWGGSAIETWMTPDALANDPASAQVNARWREIVDSYPENLRKYEQQLAEWETEKADAEAAGEPFTNRRPRPPADRSHRDYPSNCYNAMIHGLKPIALQGVIWYQGESNAWRHEQYRTLFPSLIRDWRDAFEDDQLEFLWVQLAAFNTSEGRAGRVWPRLREAQALALELPLTGQVVTLDIGDATDIHPRDKMTVGRRLARIALSQTYGYEIPFHGPRLEKAAREDDGFRIHFSGTERGLFTPEPELKGFEVAGEDRDFHPAQATIEGDTVYVTSDAVSDPVSVRYAWTNTPEAGLFNREGLPAEPFRTDDW